MARTDTVDTVAPLRKRRSPGRSITSGILITLAVLLTPVSIVANWASIQVDNTQHFVDTLGPLASNPKVQELVITEITNKLDDAIDIKDTTSSLIDGLGNALNLPEPAKKALGLVSDPIAAGVKGLVHDAVSNVVKSKGFQKAWVKVLTVTQEQVTGLLKGEEGGALSLANDGTISMNLKPVITEVKQSLVNNGVAFADAIPELDITIDLGKVPELAVARVIYQIGVGVGTWLPWIVLGMFLLGIALAVRRGRAIVTSAVFVLIVSVVLLIGFDLGRMLAINAVGDAYAQAVGVVYDAIAAYVVGVVAAMVALSIIVGVAAWVASGDERAPIRRGMTAALAWSRTRLDGVGMTMGSFGHALYRARVVIRVVIVALGILVLMTAQPVSVASVIWTSVVVLLLLLILELLLRVPPVASGGKATGSASGRAKTKPAVSTATRKPSVTASRARKRS